MSAGDGGVWGALCSQSGHAMTHAHNALGGRSVAQPEDARSRPRSWPSLDALSANATWRRGRDACPPAAPRAGERNAEPTPETPPA